MYIISSSSSFSFSCMHHHLVSGFSVFDCCSKNYVLNLMKMSVLIVVLKISLMIVYQTHLSKVERSKTHIQHNFKK
ncbi:unnamed protein product [Musa hybrid cultivar]